jgi:hypothetical protein
MSDTGPLSGLAVMRSFSPGRIFFFAFAKMLCGRALAYSLYARMPLGARDEIMIPKFRL